MNFNIFETYYNLAVITYHVDPKIFVFLIIISVPFYWYGWLKIGKAVLKFHSMLMNKERNSVIEIFDDKYFLIGLAINRSAWILPYIYVIFWGKNIPLWFWLLFFGWIAFGAYVFWYKIKRMLTADNE